MAEQELKKISQAELDEILDQHKLSLHTGGTQGKRADLSYCDLRELDFPHWVILVGANLAEANLAKVNLEGANLSGASLIKANLVGTYLVGANLVGANLFKANLSDANLFHANLSGTTLEGSNLANAVLGYNHSDYLVQELIQQQVKVSQLENELIQNKLENFLTPEKQEKIAELEKQLELEKQKIQELNKLKAELEQEIKLMLETNIHEANEALTNALKNTDTQIINNQKLSRSLTWLAVILICLDIAFVLAIPFLIMAGTLNELLDKTGVWAILFFTFPALLILLIALSLLRHQKQLIAEIRHYSMLKHKIELYGGILKAAQFTASSVMQSQNSEAAKYIQETFNEIKAELLKSPNFDLNAQPHIFPEEGGNLLEMLKSITELLKISTETSKAAAEIVKKTTTSEK